MIISQRKLAAIWIFGFMSGFSVMISSYTLNYWLSESAIDIRIIGIFSLVSLPYAINFIWAPIFDLSHLPFKIKFMSQKMTWLIIMQIMLAIAIGCAGMFDPLSSAKSIAIFAFLISLFASAQDTLLGALRTEIIKKEQQGRMSGLYIFGYRIGMLISSSGAVYVSQFLSWQQIYLFFSLITLFFPLIIFFLLNLEDIINVAGNNMHEIDGNYNNFSITRLLKKILVPAMGLRYLLLVIFFLILYRLPDNFINVMITPFLHMIGYAASEISTAGKLFGAISAMIGGFVASHIMKRISIERSLLMFGIFHALTHLLYIYQNIQGKNIYILYLITGFEGISGGMAMAAYIAFIASLCNGRFRATQYAFFSSMMGFSRSVFPSISGYVVMRYDWNLFFIFAIIMTVPALLLVPLLKKKNYLRKP